MLRTYILVLLYVSSVSGSVCDIPVGLEDGTIPDSSLSASSQINKWHGPSEGRLNNYKEISPGVGAWCASKEDNVQDRYIQIDLGSSRSVGRIATQGRNTTYDQYVSTYKVTYSDDNQTFSRIMAGEAEKVFNGNSDKNSVVENDLSSSPIQARYFRIHPVNFLGNICMRIELYECPAITTSPPETTTTITTAPPETTTTITTAPPETTTTAAPVCPECSHGCVAVPGGHNCTCPTGYRLKVDGKNCEDINECNENIDGCGQTCANSQGSFTCGCHSGYSLDNNGKSCSDINECSDNTDGCDHSCTNTLGSFTCRCNSGYRLDNDGKSCNDINECDEDLDECNVATTQCVNSNGTYRCDCLSGYTTTSNPFACTDINECFTGADQCDVATAYCVNSIGSYTCQCRTGYERDTDFQCKDINECQTNNGGCSHTCVNNVGSFTCTCPTGYELDGSNKICVDKNECLDNNAGCQHTCTNTVGSFQCSCSSGYNLNPDKLTCSDINECAEGTDQCNDTTTDCYNIESSYQCNCKTGYVQIIGDDYNCKPVYCPALIETQGTTVSPSSCLQSDARGFGHTCVFSCQSGYELPTNQNTLTCQSSGSWDGSVISCQKVSCPTLVAPTHGVIFPDRCTTGGNEYQHTCTYSCNSGYQLSGVQSKSCGSDGQWSDQSEPTCTLAHPAPWITCPSNVIIDLSPGSSTADISGLLGEPSSNQAPSSIKIYPERYNSNKTFPAGETMLTYVATNPDGKTANCTVNVLVKDREAPQISNCPFPIHVTTKSVPTPVSWTPPQITDNVGVDSQSSTKSPGDDFHSGTLTVYYSARDAEGNTASCSFKVTVKKLSCEDPPEGDNITLACSSFGGSKFCFPTCDGQKQMFVYRALLTCSDTTLEWDYETPDCVDSVAPNSDSSCPVTSVLQEADDIFQLPDICVKCPRGRFYNQATSTCEKCPVGSISATEGSLQCEPCPAQTSTAVEGSKQCVAQCLPGSFSTSGFDLPDNLEPCEPCPSNTYQNSLGKKNCSTCPNGTTTLQPGSTNVADCGGPPLVTQFGPNPVDAFENNQTQFECFGEGYPLPSFNVSKVVPAPAGFAGPSQQEYIQAPDGTLQGIRYIITKVKEHDEGSYQCTVTNSFGKDTKYIHVNVELDFSIGKRRRR